jgi:hypothetical protein
MHVHRISQIISNSNLHTRDHLFRGGKTFEDLILEEEKRIPQVDEWWINNEVQARSNNNKKRKRGSVIDSPLANPIYQMGNSHSNLMQRWILGNSLGTDMDAPGVSKNDVFLTAATNLSGAPRPLKEPLRISADRFVNIWPLQRDETTVRQQFLRFAVDTSGSDAQRGNIVTSERRGTADHPILVAGSNSISGKVPGAQLVQLLTHKLKGLGYAKDAARIVVDKWLEVLKMKHEADVEKRKAAKLVFSKSKHGRRKTSGVDPAASEESPSGTPQTPTQKVDGADSKSGNNENFKSEDSSPQASISQPDSKAEAKPDLKPDAKPDSKTDKKLNLV